MSPVHDQSYRRYQGARRAPGGAWRVIFRTGMRGLFGRRAFIGLVVLAWLPFLIRSVQIYLTVTYPQARQVMPVDARLFQSFIEQQGLFAFLVTIYAGAGLIANDRRANALQVYLAKPLTRLEYIIGKLSVLVVCLAAVTLVPALLLVVMHVMLAGSFALVREHPFIVPAIILGASLRVIVGSVTMVALSSMSKSTRFVSVMYAGVVFFSDALYGVLTFVTGSTAAAWTSVAANLGVITDAIFRQPPRYETPVAVSILVIAGLIAVSISVLERRVRGVEVVA
jgi:ABC-2 type transport system permease protein